MEDEAYTAPKASWDGRKHEDEVDERRFSWAPV